MKVIAVFLMLICFNVYSQDATEMSIAYGESIQLGKVEENTRFSISGEGTTAHLNGAEINEFKFMKPGKYTITIVVKEHFAVGDCNHSSFPKQINVTVSRVRMSFDGNRMQFSTPIVKNKEMAGATLSIPVTIETYDGKSVIMNDDVVTAAGIGSDLTAKLNNASQELTVGEHLLIYSLNGKVTENTYIMFDFVDSDGKIHSVALMNPIQNQQ